MMENVTRKDKIGVIVLGISICLLTIWVGAVIGNGIAAVLRGQEPQVYYFPIYKATLPFGVIQLEGRFLLASGTIGNEEVYYIKYWIGDNLCSLQVDAEDCPIVVDGTFQIESSVKPPMPWRGYIRLHIPMLPKVNQTLTTDWSK